MSLSFDQIVREEFGKGLFFSCLTHSGPRTQRSSTINVRRFETNLSRTVFVDDKNENVCLAAHQVRQSLLNYARGYWFNVLKPLVRGFESVDTVAFYHGALMYHAGVNISGFSKYVLCNPDPSVPNTDEVGDCYVCEGYLSNKNGHNVVIPDIYNTPHPHPDTPMKFFMNPSSGKPPYRVFWETGVKANTHPGYQNYPEAYTKMMLRLSLNNDNFAHYHPRMLNGHFHIHVFDDDTNVKLKLSTGYVDVNVLIYATAYQTIDLISKMAKDLQRSVPPYVMEHKGMYASMYFPIRILFRYKDRVDPLTKNYREFCRNIEYYWLLLLELMIYSTQSIPLALLDGVPAYEAANSMTHRLKLWDNIIKKMDVEATNKFKQLIWDNLHLLGSDDGVIWKVPYAVKYESAFTDYTGPRVELPELFDIFEDVAKKLKSPTTQIILLPVLPHDAVSKYIMYYGAPPPSEAYAVGWASWIRRELGLS